MLVTVKQQDVVPNPIGVFEQYLDKLVNVYGELKQFLGRRNRA
jgi:hypothetical protein